VLATLGDTARAKDWASVGLSLDPDDLLTRYNTAYAYALMDQAESALDLLERVIPRIRGRLQTRIRHDSDFNSLRAHPRFRALLEIVAR
jgi:adenylate cyclase